MRTRAENLSILRNASGRIYFAGSPAGERVRTRDESLRIVQSAAMAPTLPAILNREAAKNPANGTPSAENYELVSDNDVGATLAFTRPKGSPSEEAAPMGYGRGGTAGGGGGQGGRADTRAGLQEQLNALDKAAAYVTTTEQSDGIEQQRRPVIEQLRQMDDEEGRSGVYTAGDRLKNAASNTKLIVQQGLTTADHTIAQTADWLFGGIAKEGRALLNTTLQSINPDWGFENEDPLITQYNKKGAEALAHNQAIAEKRIEEGKLDPTVWKYGPQVVAAVPDAVLALLTYGSSTAAQATTKSLEAASRLARGGKLYQKVAPLVQSTVDMMKSPQWMSAFARNAGSSYEAALADGATEEQATLYALANSYANATIEVGGGDEALGGIQKLPKQLQNLIQQGASNKLLLWAKSTLSEAGEEVWQGVTEKGLRRLYAEEVPLYSRSDENAVINPARMKEEAKGGFVVGGVLSGGQTTAQSLGTAIKAAAGNKVPLQQNIDSNGINDYYNYVERKGGSNNASGGNREAVSGGSAEADIGRVPGVYAGRDGLHPNQQRPDGAPVDSGFVLLSHQAQDTLRERGIAVVETRDVSNDKSAFSAALDSARNTDARNGWAVTPKSAEELESSGARPFMSENGAAGFVVAPDGDIEAVFANKTAGAPAGTTKSMIPQAIANGGTKLDCYGEGLVRLYIKYGFIPVARTKFDPQYANPGWDPSKGTPDIFFMMHNGDGADTVVQKNGNYPVTTAEQLDALPELDYDSAYAYRDRLLAERSGKAGPENGTQSGGEADPQNSAPAVSTTAAANTAAQPDPAAAAVEEEYRNRIAYALQCGDYQRAAELYREYNNPALRAYKEFYTQKIFSEYAVSQGYIPATEAFGDYTSTQNLFGQETVDYMAKLQAMQNTEFANSDSVVSSIKYDEGVRIDNLPNAKYNFRKIKGEHDIFQDIGTRKQPTCNPNFSKGGDFANNCGYCCGTLEMRRRGYDVIANPKNTMLVSDWLRLFENTKTLDLKSKHTDKLLNELKLKLSSMGNGARGSLFVKWRGRRVGHFFSWEVNDGKVMFIDAQNGNMDAVKYFSLIEPDSVICIRWDNLNPTDLIKVVCKNRGGNS